MRIPREFKIIICFTVGIFGTMFIMLAIFLWQNIIIIGEPSQALNAAFAGTIGGFMGGSYTMIAIDKWTENKCLADKVSGDEK